jgi:hypothetical protein
MSKIFVIAGDSIQAMYWINTNLRSRVAAGETTLSMSEYVPVLHPDVFRGYKDPHGVFFGTWRGRRDLEEIFVMLLRSTDIKSNSHRVINRMWSEWKEGK